MENSDSFLKLIQKIDQLIKKGHAWCALKELSRLTLTQNCPRDFAAPFANLYRRVGKPNTGLKLLAPFFRSKKNISDSPQPQELIEYALCLHAVGATDEAIDRLKKMDSGIFPEALIYQVHCHISRWDYKKTVPILEKYLQSPEISDYQKAIAKTNLAAALVHCQRHDQADDLIAENLDFCLNRKWMRLLVNNRELQAQSCIQQKKYEEAKLALESTSQHLVSDILIDRWFVQKWKSILRAYTEESLHPISYAIELAKKNGHWESVRDLEYQIFLINGDQETLNKVYFGTPYTAFRDRLSPGHKNLVTPSYKINPGMGEQLDSQTGRIGKVEVFNPGKNIHKVLLALIDDLYRPLSIGHIFCQMFPGEVFNPEASTNRIHQLLLRTRKHFEANNLPLEIVNDDHGYRLVFKGEFSIIKHLREKQVDSAAIQLDKLLNRFFDDPFSTKAAEKILRSSTSTTTRLLNKGISIGLIEKTGKGPKTRYRFVDESTDPFTENDKKIKARDVA